MSEYFSMPKLFKLDPFDECFAEEVRDTKDAYCIVDVYIQPNKSNIIWNAIEKYSQPWKTNYRHDHLVYGICLSRCKDLMSKFDAWTQKEYFISTPKGFNEPSIEVYAFEESVEDQFQFGEMTNECINYEMKKKYQLEAYSKLQYCEVAGREEEIGTNEVNRTSCNLQAKLFCFR